MPAPPDKDPRADVKELLLTDYRTLSETLWRNEQIGETRVNWFIGIVTAAAGGLIGLTSAEHRPHGEPLRLIYLAALFTLLCFGVVTLFRMFKRNETTDGFKKDSERIRQMFRDQFDDAGLLRSYRPFRPSDSEGEPLRKIGGLTYTVAIINSLIVGGMAAAFIYPFGWPSNRAAERPTMIWRTYVAGSSVFALSLFIQIFLIRWKEARAKQKLDPTTHAGGIVFRHKGEGVEYLLIRPSQKRGYLKDEWLLPKGHIESGEEQWETALREVREETGVVGRLICPVGFDQFELEGKKVKVKYYLLEHAIRVVCKEKRKSCWFDLETAKDKLTYPKSRRLLFDAEQKRRSIKKAGFG